MKKYNLSKIMKRAWELVKKAGMTISSGLKKAWKEAKSMGKILTLNVTGKETFTVNTKTGESASKSAFSLFSFTLQSPLPQRFTAFHASKMFQSSVDVV